MTEPQNSIPEFSIKSLDGIAPEFDTTVTLPRLGVENGIPLGIRAMGIEKSKWTAMRDDFFESARSVTAPAGATFTESIDTGAHSYAKFIMKFVVGWKLKDEFTEDNLVALDMKLPGSMNAIVEGVNLALVHGRVGN